MRISTIAAASLLVGVLFTGCNQAATTPTTQEVKTSVLKTELTTIKYEKALEFYNNKSALFVDARPMKLYKKGTIMGSINISTKEYASFKNFLPSDKNAPIIPFCNGFECEKSDVLAKMLQKDGYTNVLIYKGGYPEWEQKKQPLMAVKKECKVSAPVSSYKPELEAITVNDVNIYLLPEDGEANEDGVIDQFWLNDAIKNNTVPKGIHIVDVRKSVKYDASHIEGAINVPFNSDEGSLDLTKLPEDGVIVFYCNTGLKSTDARGSIEDEELLERVFIFDITYKCDKENKNCKVNPNEAL